MNKIIQFIPLPELEHYDCFRMGITAIAKNYYIPELTPFCFEAGLYNIDFNFLPGKFKTENINKTPIDNWRQFNRFLPLEYDLLREDLMKQNFGLSIISGRNIIDSEHRLEFVMKYVKEEKLPVIIGCNPYHLPFTDDYKKNPGGYFKSYHFIVVININDDKVTVYDPIIKNYLGKISIENFINSVRDKNGILHEEGFRLATVKYDGKKFLDLNNEIAIKVLKFYFQKNVKIPFEMIRFCQASLSLYDEIELIEKKKFLLAYLEKSLFFYSRSRIHFSDFLSIMNNYEEIKKLDLQLHELNEEILSGTRFLFINSQRNNQRFSVTQEKLEVFLDKIIKIMEEEISIFKELYSVYIK